MPRDRKRGSWSMESQLLPVQKPAVNELPVLSAAQCMHWGILRALRVYLSSMILVTTILPTWLLIIHLGRVDAISVTRQEKLVMLPIPHT